MQIKSSFKGLAATFIMLFFLATCLSIYYYFADISSHPLRYLVSFIIATAFLLGGFTSGYSAGEKGLLHGTVTALTGILILLIIIGLGIDAPKIWSQFYLNALFAIIASAIGGVIGVSKN